MKTIKIKFCDFWPGFNLDNNFFIDILKERYEVILSDTPDYLFYSAFGYNHTKYDCVKVFYTAECVSPNFSICDYAVAFDYLDYGERYYRLPNYYLYQKDLKLARVRGEGVFSKTPKTDFCSFVVSNDNGMAERKRIFELLNNYKTVSSGGRYLNNVGGPVKDKNEFQSKHKFSIAFENCSFPGYTTEKIIQSFAAGTVPIYFGDPIVGMVFNTKAFINCHDFASMEDVVKRIIEIDNDDELFKKMLSEPAFIDETDLLIGFKSFLFNIFDKPEPAKMRPANTYIGYEEQKENVYRIVNKLFLSFLRKVKSFFRRLKNGSL